MDFLGLLGCGGLARANGPDGFVGDDDFAEILFREVEHGAFQLGLHHLVLFAGLTLLERLTNAENHFQTVFLCQQHLFPQDFGRFLVIFATLGVAQNHVLRTRRFHHFGTHLARECAFFLVGAVLGTQSDDVLVEEVGNLCQMDERRANHHVALRLVGLQHVVEFLRQGDAFGQIHVHFPVTCYNLFSHVFLNLMTYLRKTRQRYEKKRKFRHFSSFFLLLLRFRRIHFVHAHVRSASVRSVSGSTNQSKISTILPGVDDVAGESNRSTVGN